MRENTESSTLSVMAGKVGDDVAVAPGLLTMSVDSFDQPGFNLGMDDWFTQENEPPKKKKRLSLRRPQPLRDSNRFSKPVEAAVLEEAVRGVVPSKTEQSNRWAVSNFNTVFFCVGLHFALRGVQEQHDPVSAQFSRVPADPKVYNASVCYEYTEFLSKNNQH